MKLNEIGKGLGLVCLMLAGACSSGGGDGDNKEPGIPVTPTNYVVDFSPQQVIAANAVPASVTATASLSTASGDEITASGSVTVNGVTATAVTINAGYAGENGPVALTLTDAGGGRWNVPSNTLLDVDERSRLEVTGFYVSIQTPNGELRGQIRLPTWGVGVVGLDANSVVPGSTSSGTGKAGFAINPQTGQFRVRITVDGVANVTGAGLRNAIAGARGDVITTLEQSMTDANVWGTIDINNPDAGNRLNQTGIDLFANGSLYFSVESMANMDGDLRGQLVDNDIIKVFDTTLTTSEVVTSGPPVNSSAQGIATVTWGETLSLFAIAVNTDITNAISASVHQGAAGAIGTAVFSLMPDPMLPGNWSMPVAQLDAAQTAAFMNDEFYVSVVTAAHAEGELRGQLSLNAQTATAVIVPTVDATTARQAALDANGGQLTMTSDNGSLITAEVPDFAVLSSTNFSMTEITSVTGFPAGTRLLAAAQMGPAGQIFSSPVKMTFDVTGLRSPESVLVGFRTDNDGSDLQLLPVRDQLGQLGLASAALNGNQVVINVFGFSNIGVIEIPKDRVPTFSFEVISQQPEPEFDDDLLLDFFNAILDTSLSIEEINAMAESNIAELIRKRRLQLAAEMVAFADRAKLSAADRHEYLALYFAMLITLAIDDLERPDTSFEEIQTVFEMLVDFSEIYGAGLHLQCFIDPAGVEPVLSEVSTLLILRVAEDLLADNSQVSFDDIVARANELSKCYEQTVLDAYFESFDLPTGDEITGMVTNAFSIEIDNIAGTTSTADIADQPGSVRFWEPRLVATDPLTFEFKEAIDDMLGVYTDTARLVMDPPNGLDRIGTLTFEDEEEYTFATTAEQQQHGERAIITTIRTNTASGTILLTPTAIDIAYRFQYRETRDSLLENITRGLQGDLNAGKAFTPRTFAAEIELYE